MHKWIKLLTSEQRKKSFSYTLFQHRIRICLKYTHIFVNKD